MTDKQSLEEITLDKLTEKSQVMFNQGYRLAQIGATRIANGFEVNYSFDKNYEFINFKLIMPLENTKDIPSISNIYPNAFLYENEIHDLFGLKIINISIDFQGNLYKIAQKTPFNIAPKKELK